MAFRRSSRPEPRPSGKRNSQYPSKSTAVWSSAPPCRTHSLEAQQQAPVGQQKGFYTLNAYSASAASTTPPTKRTGSTPDESPDASLESVRSEEMADKSESSGAAMSVSHQLPVSPESSVESARVDGGL